MSDYPVQQDDEDVVREVLADLLDELDVPEGTTVGVGVPQGWKRGSPPHIQVASDGTSTIDDVHAVATVRVVAWADSTTEAKRIAALVQAVLVTRHDLVNAVALTGVLAARDDKTNAEIASTTVQVAAVLA